MVAPNENMTMDEATTDERMEAANSAMSGIKSVVEAFNAIVNMKVIAKVLETQDIEDSFTEWHAAIQRGFDAFSQMLESTGLEAPPEYVEAMKQQYMLLVPEAESVIRQNYQVHFPDLTVPETTEATTTDTTTEG
jgi:hypothetical protein